MCSSQSRKTPTIWGLMEWLEISWSASSGWYFPSDFLRDQHPFFGGALNFCFSNLALAASVSTPISQCGLSPTHTCQYCFPSPHASLPTAIRDLAMVAAFEEVDSLPIVIGAPVTGAASEDAGSCCTSLQSADTASSGCLQFGSRWTGTGGQTKTY